MVLLEDELYNRQTELNIAIPTSVAVIGVGGVGSWVAINMALTGTKKIVLVDCDVVDGHNLNRTLFKEKHIGGSKVSAVSELIIERRKNIEVVPIDKRIEECNDYEMSEITGCDYIIDCRDRSDGLPDEIEEKARMVTGGYDGYNVTIHLNRNLKSIWGDEPFTYTVTPSWLIPPQFLALFITLYICTGIEYADGKEVIASFNVLDLIGWVKEK